ncbi:class I SAM-dependent methyltransferase [Halochromatium salexigens]|uniref:Class I SAM-dependent methyltransferase n=1 Tax=Halochromatium salexigens TaxID=49447 RepID=A0AAJ0UDE6_HALSE|nr:class I SAM-dependent methyltransferase [Halochromatium salexigens]MBK5929397.1 hypothetical protein [Halochromatium salexigens]
MDESTINLIEVAAFLPASLRFPPSWIGHLPFAAWIIQQVRPTLFVELGTHTGNSYFAFCQLVQEHGLPTRCYAVDTWQGDAHSGEYSDNVWQTVDAWNKKHYEAFSRLLPMTFDEAAQYFSDGSIGLLHIDGLHTYEAVRHDFETWLPKLAQGAVVLFHDTTVRERDFGVWRLWEELGADYNNRLEFTHCNGLGVLQLPGSDAHQSLAWLDPEYHGRQALKTYFATLGARQLERYELASRVKKLDDTNQIVAQRDAQIQFLQHTLAERDREQAETSARLSAIEASWLWRFGVRFRSIINWLERRVRLLGQLPRLIRHHGGVRQFLRHLHSLWRREGFAGFRMRLRALTLPQPKSSLEPGSED